MADSEKTLAALDHVIGYYHVAEEMEPVIRDGLAAFVSLLVFVICDISVKLSPVDSKTVV